MFADGMRQDGMSDALQFTMLGNLSEDDSGAWARRWANGRFRFEYPWSDITSAKGSQASLPAGEVSVGRGSGDD
jgi:hypothetical protein